MLTDKRDPHVHCQGSLNKAGGLGFRCRVLRLIFKVARSHGPDRETSRKSPDQHVLRATYRVEGLRFNI